MRFGLKTSLSIGAAVLLVGAPLEAPGADIATPEQVARRIDGFLQSHWKARGVQSAALADDATFLRRVTLDLTGRLPTARELERFLKDRSKQKRQRVIREFVNGPEFPLHFGNVLDRMIQGQYAGNTAFIDYLRKSLRDGKHWDALFREMMLGPWDTAERKPANRFLDKRARQLELLTADATRVFFGVDISCAKCHDHPLVDDWKQTHFYGMASFFNRTTGGRGKVGEKPTGEVTYPGPDGKDRTAKMMFLSGQVISEPKPAKGSKNRFSRREQLVRTALEQKSFFSRSFVNRMWRQFFGRGLVEPVDQMHSGNASAVPGLLDWLAADFAQSGYDIRRLVAAIVSTRVYQLSSRWERDAPLPEASLFAIARLRPLSPRQLAFALLQATGNARLSEPDETQRRVERYVGVSGLQRIGDWLRIEREATSLIEQFDEPAAEFQSSAEEALFLSNHEDVQKLVAAGEDNLVARLSQQSGTREVVTAAVRAVYNRPASAKEADRLAKWFDAQRQERSKTCEQLVWALVTSAEFRFNH